MAEVEIVLTDALPSGFMLLLKGEEVVGLMTPTKNYGKVTLANGAYTSIHFSKENFPGGQEQLEQFFNSIKIPVSHDIVPRKIIEPITDARSTQSIDGENVLNHPV